MTATVLRGSMLDRMASIADGSVHAVVTDPPYGLSNTDPRHVAEALQRWLGGERDWLPSVTGGGFMGRDWDSFVPPPAAWDECMRVLRPGGYLLAFAGSRTFDLMTLSIRLAGFDVRDSIAWLYSTGMPKGLDVSRAIDRELGAKRKPTGKHTKLSPMDGTRILNGYGNHSLRVDNVERTDEPATDQARAWSGWNTALKPAFEPIVVARKPLEGGSVARNVLTHGVGALNVDATRIGTEGGTKAGPSTRAWGGVGGEDTSSRNTIVKIEKGRHPANVMLDEHAAVELDTVQRRGIARRVDGLRSRFYYVAKAPSAERIRVDGVAHPTVKPLTLMRELVTLVTPDGGVVLDPFAGSGTTLEAAALLGFDCIGIEREPDYLPIITARLQRAGLTTREV